MSEQTPSRNPLLSIATSIVATVKCCSGNISTVTETVISGNTDNILNGDPSQTVAPLVKTASSMSTDLTPIVEENAEI
jgi:acetylglutamate synthase